MCKSPYTTLTLNIESHSIGSSMEKLRATNSVSVENLSTGMEQFSLRYEL